MPNPSEFMMLEDDDDDNLILMACHDNVHNLISAFNDRIATLHL
jgi:hypothetical protein